MGENTGEEELVGDGPASRKEATVGWLTGLCVADITQQQVLLQFLLVHQHIAQGVFVTQPLQVVR